MNKNIENIIKNKDMDNADIVVESYKPLLISAINKFYNKPHLYEELLQEGYLEICEAILDFDESKNIYFSGYLKSRIYYFYLGKNNKNYDYIPLDMKINSDEDFSLLDIIPDSLNIEEDYILKERKEIIKKAINSLTKRQKEIILDFYFNNMSMVEIAKKYSINYRTVVNTKVNGLKKMKKYLTSISNL